MDMFQVSIRQLVGWLDALHPKSTAMVMSGRSVHLTILFFLTKLEQAVNQYFVHILYAGGDSSKHMPVVMFQVNICQ